MHQDPRPENAHSYCSQALTKSCLTSTQSSWEKEDKGPLGPAVVETSMITMRVVQVEGSSSEESTACCGIAGMYL